MIRLFRSKLPCVEVIVTGVKLVDNTERVKAALKEQLAGGLNAAADHVANEARNNANIDTGFMKSAIGVSVAATPNSLFAVVRSLARYSMYQDTGIHGNMFWTRAYLATRNRFKQFIYQGRAYTGGAGADVIKAAEIDYHGVTGRKGRGF